MSVAQLSMSLFAANQGFLDDVDKNKVTDFEEALQGYLASSEQELMDEINASGNYDSKIEEKMKKAIENFKATSTW
jgi:F-type H+-transporting ATPase subunit alpha